MNGWIRSCYISAPPGANLTVLRDALSRRNVRVVVPDELSISSGIANQVEQLLSQVDLMVAVVTANQRSANVFFELGMAKAKGVQTIVIAPPSGTVVPLDLPGSLYIRTSLSNADAINFALNQILAAPEPRSEPESKQIEPSPVLGARSAEYLRQLEGLQDGLRAGGLEMMVAEALQAAGVEVLSTAPHPDMGADLAIWSDALQSYVGNPLLIEIKFRIRGREELRRATRQLSKAIEKSGTSWGLLLYGMGPSATHLRSYTAPNVLLMSLTELFQRMQYEPFPDVIRDLRNRRVHGEGY